MKYTRNCPECNIILSYDKRSYILRANRLNSRCKKCASKENVKNRKKRTKTIISNFFRNCPKCDKIVYYSGKNTLNNAIKKNSICNICGSIEKLNKINEEIKNGKRENKGSFKKNSIPWNKNKCKGIIKFCLLCQEKFYVRPGLILKKHFCSNRCQGKYYSGDKNVAKRQNVKNKISKIKRNGTTSTKGKTYEEIMGEEMAKLIKKNKRKIAISRLNNRGISIVPFYNVKSIEYLELLNMWNGWDLQHAENGGEYCCKELNYWFDGYDEKLNIVVEFYEKSHYYSDKTLNKKTLNREREIIEYLNPMFIRIHNYDNIKLEQIN